MNEWGFAAEVKSWWDGAFRVHPEWGFDRCEVEQTTEGSRLRSDLAVLGGGVVRLCGELRLPDHPTASPWHPDNLQSAVGKARFRGARWAFTSDGCSLVMMDLTRTGPPLSLVVRVVDLVHFDRREELDSGGFLARIESAWVAGLDEIGPMVAGLVLAAGLAADEAFINSLRALLLVPVAANAARINGLRSSDPAFSDALVRWMVDEQGWAHLPQTWEREIQRTAQLSSYVFLTRLMFYEAMRRARPALSDFNLPDVPADVARGIVRTYFEHARAISGDYETVFAWDRAAEYALIADGSIAGWRRLLEHIAAFDLAHVAYDVMGRVFERLIDPHERYEWGQHYTQPDVVDLMLSLAIPDGKGIVLDPATGGGTFLVRAYVRKRLLRPGATHEELLGELYGLEVSAFAANLATINLAVRDLTFGANYPRVTVRSFFAVEPESTFMTLPPASSVSLGEAGSVPVRLARVRAVASNPPYVRHQLLGRQRLAEAQRVLGRRLGRVPTPPRLRGSPNYHVYFWLHAGEFLEPGGHLVMITSGEWMDSDYGVALQSWLLDNFRLECFIESIAEPWFSEARVGTVVVSARQCDDPEERGANRVPFVLLRRPLRELYGGASDEGDHLRRVDALRDRILGLSTPIGESDDLDWSVVSQADLGRLGTRSGTSR